MEILTAVLLLINMLIIGDAQLTEPAIEDFGRQMEPHFEAAGHPTDTSSTSLHELPVTYWGATVWSGRCTNQVYLSYRFADPTHPFFNTPMWIQQQMANWPQDQVLTRDQMDALLTPDVAARLNVQQQARILEAAALTAYHEQDETPIISILLSDDASQFQHITQQQALCWIHEGRHYKKLTPFVEHHQQLLDGFQTQFWDFYHELLDYREAPASTQADRLRADFEKLFSTTTGYEALDRRIAKTLTKQERLLLVLEHPQLPLHNNPAELAVRQRVRKRDISFGPRTDDGVAAWDTFNTLNETAKKLGVNFYAYIHDRVSDARMLPSLASLVQLYSLSDRQELVPD